MGLFDKLKKKKPADKPVVLSASKGKAVGMPLKATGTDNLFVGRGRTSRNLTLVSTESVEARDTQEEAVSHAVVVETSKNVTPKRVAATVEEAKPALSTTPAVRVEAPAAPVERKANRGSVERHTKESAAPQKTVEQFTDLPAAVKMYGVGKRSGSLTKDQRHVLGALIHEDGTASVLWTQQAQRTAHLRNAFLDAVNEIAKVKAEYLVTSTVLASAYAHYGEATGAESGRTAAKTDNSHAKQFAFDFIQQAIDAEASDIHLEVRKQGNNSAAALKFRIDGDLEPVQTFDLPAEVEVASKAIAVLFQGDYADDRSRSNSQQSDIVMQHALVRVPELNNVALRFQTIIANSGYDLILRLLTYDGKSESLVELPNLGLEPDHIEWLIEAVSRPYGASFIGGSTNSGKTTLMAALMHADPLKYVRKRYTAEDPVEIEMPDVTQVNIPRSASDTSEDPFVTVMKGFLRGDPDLIMVGEIREKATASMLMHGALSGHNMWATLHINRMFDALYRLVGKLGVDHQELGSNTVLNLLSSQTLVKRLCTCAIPVADALKRGMIDQKTIDAIKGFEVDTEGMLMANIRGQHNRNECPHCKGKGEKGRTACIEMALMDDELKDLVYERQFEEVERTYRKRRTSGFGEPGMLGKTMLDHGMLKAVRGEISVHRLTGFGKDLTAELKSRRFRGYM